MTWILPRQLHTSACALDTEALISDLEESSRICGQSLFVKSKPMQSRTWLRKWKQDSWTQHLSGRILKPFLGQHFAIAWTSSLGATLANHSQQREDVTEHQTRATSGHTSQMELPFPDPDSASLRTSRDISAWGCPTSSKTWQEWVTERRGAYSRRLKSALPTRGNGSSSWPTVTVQDSHNTPCQSQMERNTPPLVVAVHGHPVQAKLNMNGNRQELWRTPNSQLIEAKSDGIKLKNRTPKDPQVGLADQVKAWAVQSWPTPSAMDGQRPSETPQQWETRNAAKKASNPNLGQLHRPLTVAVQWAAPRAGKLNPRWVETLMGLPVGWTMPSCVFPVTIERMNSGSSETELCQPQQH